MSVHDTEDMEVDPPDPPIIEQMEADTSSDSDGSFYGFEGPFSSTLNARSLTQAILTLTATTVLMNNPIPANEGNVSHESIPSDIDLSPPQFLEASIEDLDIGLPCFVPDDDDDIPEYILILNGTSRGCDMYVDSNGYEYTFKEFTKKGGLECWRCPHRRSGDVKYYCKAVYLPGRIDPVTNLPQDPRGQYKHPHTCEKQYKPQDIRRLRRDLKQEGLLKLLDPAMEIVKKGMKDIPSAELKRLRKMPSRVRLAAQINWRRRSIRPQQITCLRFEIAEACIPQGFLQKDINDGESRHLIFASSDQLKILRKAVTWYVDGTFKIVKQPFAQLFSVHVFIRSGFTYAHIPVAFVIMSGRTAKDYVSVFKALLELVGRENCKVERIVLDFERAVWSALKGMMGRDEFPPITIKGCFFHFTQAVFRRIQNLGMKKQYIVDAPTKDICKRMMSLPLLPLRCIPSAFSVLKQRCDESGIECLQKFGEYMRKNWIEGYFSPDTWFQFLELIRTNNHVEGWHRGLNTRVKGANVNTYHLIQVLEEEAIAANQTAIEVETGKYKAQQARVQKQRNEELIQLWEQLRIYLNNNGQGGMSMQSFLRNASKGTEPVEHWEESRVELLDPDDPSAAYDDDL